MDEALAHARRSYEQLGLAELLPNAPMTKEDLGRILAAVEPKLRDIPCRIVPSSFDPDDPELRAFPLDPSWTWRSLAAHLASVKPFAVMMRLPMFWQMEAPIHAAGQSVGAPIFVNDPENIPVGGVAVRDASMEAVVTTEGDVHAFAQHLTDKHLPFPKLFLSISQADKPDRDAPTLPAGVRLAKEIHLFPGFVLLSQCPDLASRREPLFHASESFVWEYSTPNSLITSTRDAIVPLVRYELPFSLTEHGTCSCGRTLVEKKN